MDQERQSHLMTCENVLANPENIDANQLAQFMASKSELGLNDILASILQRYFYANLTHPDLIKYLHLIDKLIKREFPLPTTFTHMYAECYKNAIQNGRKSSQEQLKILRKIWTPILSNEIIQALRVDVYRLIGVDIQMELREESKRFLQNYFQKHMMLSKQAIQDILVMKPMGRTPSPTREIGMFNEHQSQYPPTPVFSFHPYPYPTPPNMIPTHIAPQSQLQMQRERPFLDLSLPQKIRRQQIPINNYSKVGGLGKNNTEVVVRRVGVSKAQLAALMYNRLKEISNFSCRECGKCYQTMIGLEKHRQQHFEEKVRRFQVDTMNESLKKIKTLKVSRRELSVSQWLQGSDEREKGVDLGDDLSNSFVFVKDMYEGVGIALCSFCKCGFQLGIEMDQFVFRNAVKVDFGQVELVHEVCYRTLADQDQMNGQTKQYY